MPTPPLIPLPGKVQYRDGEFVLCSKAAIECPAAALDTAAWLQEQLRVQIGFQLPIVQRQGDGSREADAAVHAGAPAPAGCSALRLSLLDSRTRTSLGAACAEAYSLSICSTGVYLSSWSPAGLLRAVATLLQLLPPAPPPHPADPIRLPAMDIEDAPRFPWRVLLDVRYGGIVYHM